jgi:hypothetical protein
LGDTLGRISLSKEHLDWLQFPKKYLSVPDLHPNPSALGMKKLLHEFFTRLEARKN